MQFIALTTRPHALLTFIDTTDHVFFPSTTDILVSGAAGAKEGGQHKQDWHSTLLLAGFSHLPAAPRECTLFHVTELAVLEASV